jgi:hypothetical protein
MKLKALVAALAVIGAGVANASYPLTTDTSASSALLMTVWDSAATTSAVFDLGVSRTDFLTDTVCSSNCTNSLVITWNLATNSVSSNLDSWSTGGTTSYSLASLGLSGVTNSWSSAYSTLSASGVYSSGTVYDVISFDRDGGTVTASHALTTATGKPSNTTNSNLILMGSNAADFVNQNASLGTNLAADNGASVSTTLDSTNQGSTFVTNWGGALKGASAIAATTSLGSSLSFYEIEASSTSSVGKATSTQLGTWTLSSDGATLTYSALVAVPEPSSIAMLLAGLGLMGVISRRRMI